MINYDTLKEVYALQRDRSGEVVSKTSIPLEAFLWLVDSNGNVPDPPYPACQITTMDGMMLLPKNEIEVHYHED